jgi:hypothetical protein
MPAAIKQHGLDPISEATVTTLARVLMKALLVWSAFPLSQIGSPAMAQSSAWTYDIFVNECRKAGGTVGSTLEQYNRGERFICQRGGSGSSQPGPEPSCSRDAKINTDWVLSQDRGARLRFNQAIGAGKSAFDALLIAQGHNPGAQKSLLACQGWVESYLRRLGENRDGRPAAAAPTPEGCPCISIIPTGNSDFEGRAEYRVSNRCAPLNVTVVFVDAAATSSSARADAGLVGRAATVKAPATFRIPSLEAYNIRNDSGSYTCRCKPGACN